MRFLIRPSTQIAVDLVVVGSLIVLFVADAPPWVFFGTALLFIVLDVSHEAREWVNDHLETEERSIILDQVADYLDTMEHTGTDIHEIAEQVLRIAYDDDVVGDEA
ncbi:hypothetical protein GTQ99_00465 [Kineococcus sp. T13]|uniref:hypothetical protein n=1 Tax=Kineococcus vitellinus TaxID=2696565 RepID=UPI0014135DBE|nr:hypothetical protein [Kineococcus vitellinus]NAZ73904.1 hypothetical protein [Kineococcus vitellinus]